MGPIAPGKGDLKFIIVTVDYFTKWVKVEALKTIMATNITIFQRKIVVCRFGIPQTIIVDNMWQFEFDHIRNCCAETGRLRQLIKLL